MRTSSDTLISRFVMEIATACFTAAIGAIVTVGSLEFGIGWGDAGPQPGYFPFYIGLIVILASGGALVQALIAHRDRREAFLTREQGSRVLAFFGPMLAFVVLAVLLGLYVALMLYLFGVMTLQGGYRPLKAALVSVGSAVVFYVVFEIWFLVPLLKGPLEPLLRIH
jgi:hypothetical protein